MYKSSRLVKSILSIYAVLSCTAPAFCNPLNALKVNPFKLAYRAEAVTEAVSVVPVIAVAAPVATLLIYDYQGHDCQKMKGGTLAAMKAAVKAPVAQIVDSASENDCEGLHPVANLVTGKF